MDTVGSGCMSCSIPGMEDAGCIFLFGYNPADSHPIVARRIVRAKEKGCKIIVADPRHIETARIADLYLPIKNGCNVAFLNAFANCLVNDGLYDKEFVAEHTNGFDEWWETIKNYTPESVQDITGVEPALIHQAAEMYATAKPSAIIGWGMGVCQQKQNLKTVHTIASIACVAGQIGKPNSGLAPVRGQNNVQGSCDMGMLPNLYPGYQKVTDPAVRAKFAKAWGVPEEKLPLEEGYKLTDLGHLVDEGKVHCFYNYGEDPVQTEPDSAGMRKTLSELDLFICQDIFMTQTTMLADVILPATSWGEHEGVFTASDRSFQHFDAAVPPKGECRHDWEIFADLSTRMGYPMHYDNTEQIWNECISLCPNFVGATYEKMAPEGGYAQWPVKSTDVNDHGTADMFAGGKFTTKDGRANLMAHDWEAPSELPDDEYPLILCTVREVGHYSCRSMTGNCKTLALLADEPGFVRMNPADAQARGIKNGDIVSIHSRRGQVYSRADVSDRINKGTVYMTYQWWIGKCNELTMHKVDPVSHTPEDKFSACQVDAIADQVWAEGEVERQYTELKQALVDAVAPQDVEPGAAKFDDETHVNQIV